MKRITAVLAVMVFLVLSISVYSADSQIGLYINGAKLAFDQDAVPYIDNDRTLLPIRKVSEALNAKVDWDENTRTVTIVKGNKTIKLVIDNIEANVDDKKVSLDVPARIKFNRTYVPIRFASESLGVNVTWEPKTRTIKLEQPKIKVSFDKTTAKVGEIIKAAIKASDFSSISGYQFNLKYDPQVLQAVDLSTGKPYTDSTSPAKGDLLLNDDYSIFPATYNNVEKGIINTGRSYLNVEAYRKSGKPEKAGTLAVIGFKVLKAEPTEIKFVDTASLSSEDGFMVFDWNSSRVDGFLMVQPSIINK